MNRGSYFSATLILSVLFAASFVNALPIKKLTPNLDLIALAQQSYFTAHGTYFQVLFDNQLPSYETGVLSDYVNPDAVPTNTAIDQYVGPQGWGYIVRWIVPAKYNQEGASYRVDYQPDGTTITETDPIPALKPVASSTESAVL